MKNLSIITTAKDLRNFPNNIYELKDWYPTIINKDGLLEKATIIRKTEEDKKEEKKVAKKAEKIFNDIHDFIINDDKEGLSRFIEKRWRYIRAKKNRNILYNKLKKKGRRL